MATLNPKRVKQGIKKKIIIFGIFYLSEVAISPQLFYLTVQFFQNLLEGNVNAEYSHSYQNAVMLLMSDQRLAGLWLISQVLVLVLIMYSQINLRPVIDRVDIQRITEDIEIPVPAGNGQHGSERFLKESEKEQIFDTYEYVPGQRKDIQRGGLCVQMKKRNGKEMILYAGTDVHSLVIGASGCGKTRRLLLQTMWLQMISGTSIIASDVKGELYYSTNQTAKAYGYNTLAFDLRNPKKSVHYNFMQPILDAMEEGDMAKAIDFTWDLVAVLVGQQKGEPIWHNGETATIAACILIIAIDAPEEFRNLTNVYYFLAYMCEADEFGEIPLNEYLKQLDDMHPAKGVFAVARAAPFRTRSSFFTSALGTLRLFTNPNVAEMTSISDFKLQDISQEKTILYMMIPDEKKTLYPLVSLLITQLYAAQVAQANENGLRLPIPTDYDLDEVGNFPYIPVLGAMVSAGRSRGVRANLVIQDYQQLESKYKDEYKNIKTNCQIKMYLKSDDGETLKSVSENLGKYTVEVSSSSTSISGKAEREKTNANYSSSASLAGRALLEPAEVKRIKSPYAICMVSGEYPGINILPDLSMYHLNQMYGLGDEAHNTRIMMEREAGREEREVPPISLWGIWNNISKMSKKKEEKQERISFL